MVLIESFPLAIVMCFITMICWGSWVNTQKLTHKTWPFSLFYWDQAIGYLILPLILAFTLGSLGNDGLSFIDNLSQASKNAYMMALIGGVVFNLANILFVSAVGIAGMAVAFPVGLGIALIEGVLVNYIASPKGNPVLIFAGVALIFVAIVIDAIAYKRLNASNKNAHLAKGLTLSIIGGLLMGLFYYFVQKSMSGSLSSPEPGKFGPYAAVVIFSLGSFLSNFVFNTILMARPFIGNPVKYKEYFAKGTMRNHVMGISGGLINGVGVTFSFIASGAVGAAIAYGLGQGATMIAAIWGVFIWKEFKNAPKGTNSYIAAMFALFIAGLSLLVIAKM